MTIVGIKIADQPTPAPLDPSELLTPAQLAARLQVHKTWVYEQTRSRALVRNSDPLPFIRMGKYRRFYWPEVSAWLSRQKPNGQAKRLG